MEALCLMVRDTSLCGLGQTAPNPVLSTLKYFREEYDELLVQPAYLNGTSNGTSNGAASAPEAATL